MRRALLLAAAATLAACGPPGPPEAAAEHCGWLIAARPGAVCHVRDCAPAGAAVQTCVFDLGDGMHRTRICSSAGCVAPGVDR